MAKDFDFGQFFDGSREPNGSAKVNPKDPMASVHEFLKSVEETFEKEHGKEITEEEAKQAFKNKYGEPEDFIELYFKDMVQPLEKGATVGLSEAIKKIDGPVFSPAAVAGALALAHNLHKTQMQSLVEGNDGDSNEVQEKANMMIHLFTHALPDDTPEDSMVIIHAMMAVMQIKLSELALHQAAVHAAKEARGDL